MPVSVINSNLTTSNSTTRTPNKPPLAFSATDFQKWNQTTSVVYLPGKLIGTDKIPKVRGELVKAIGEKKVAAVQALSPTKYRVQFTSSSYRHERDVNGIHFRGVTLTPHPAYEEVKSVFVDRAPLQMPDQYLYEILAPYGRVLGIEHLKVKGFHTVRSGTRRVSMVITKSIPAVIKISNMPLSFRYRGQPPFCFVCQEVGHTGRDCPKSRKASKNTPNADLRPEDLRHKLNHVTEGDLRVKLTQSKKVRQAPRDGPTTTSPSVISVDHSSSNTHTPSRNNNNTDKNIPSSNAHSSSNNIPSSNAEHIPTSTDQPTHVLNQSSSSSSLTLTETIGELQKVFNIPSRMDRPAAPIRKSASSSSSQPSQAFRDTIGTLKTTCTQPSEMDSLATSVDAASFESLARETQSVAAKRTTSVCTGAFDRGFLVKLNGQVLTAKSQQAVPQVESFGFSLKPARTSSSAATTSAWSNSYKQAIGIRLSGCKGRDTSESDEDSAYDLPLAKRYRKSLEGKSTPSSVSKMEEDSVEECLHGASVVDPIVPEQLPAADVRLTDATTTIPTQEAPAVIQQPNQAAMSSPARDDDDTLSVQTASTPGSLLGSIDLPLPDSPDTLFTLLTAAPVFAASPESASRLAPVPPGAELFSDPAGQDRVRELMLELPTLDLE